MKKHSNKNTYSDSDGNRYTRNQIESKIRDAKVKALEIQRDEYGYNFCSDCQRNDCKPLDCSHNIPVKDCLENGMAELCWEVKNITIRGRRCHSEYDKNI
jgi:hypothetical protein